MGASHNSFAVEKFIIEDIVLKGLHRVDAGTIYAYLPFEVGDTFDTSTTSSVIKTLFKSKLTNILQLKQHKTKCIKY